MNLYPVFLDLKDRAVLVVGGGEVAERKAEMLLSAGARLSVGAPDLTPVLTAWRDEGRIRHLDGHFADDWLDDAWLVIAATDDGKLNQRIAALGEARRIWVNVVDNAGLSGFQVPAVIDRSPVQIAISSAGIAPMLARRLREQIETLFDHSLGTLAQLLQRHRNAIRQAYPQLGPRRTFYSWLLDSPIASLVRQSRPEAAEAALRQALAEPDAFAPKGKVSLVGAGPGDPGLLTLKALRALNEADVILYDRLVSPDILAMARRDAHRIDVGKHPGQNHRQTQLHIHEQMIEYAQQGLHVVRLKGGDAFIFGRGGEELQHLKAHGVPYCVIPGITAALACAAYSGIPLTHREHAQSVHLITAHTKGSAAEPDWAALSRSSQTLVFYMGVSQLDLIRSRLQDHGHDASTPCALIEQGSMPHQRTLIGTLDTMPVLARQHNIAAPAVLIVGDVAQLGEELHWYGQLLDTATVPAAHPSAQA